MENFVISSCLVGHTLSLSLPLTQYSCTSHMCRLPISLTSPTTPTRSHLLLHSLFLIHVTREGSFTLSLSHPSISHIYRFSLSLSLAYVTYVPSFFFSLSISHSHTKTCSMHSLQTPKLSLFKLKHCTIQTA